MNYLAKMSKTLVLKQVNKIDIIYYQKLSNISKTGI